MAAASKAQVGASLETQEISNQKLRAEGEAQADATKKLSDPNVQSAMGDMADDMGMSDMMG